MSDDHGPPQISYSLVRKPQESGRHKDRQIRGFRADRYADAFREERIILIPPAGEEVLNCPISIPDENGGRFSHRKLGIGRSTA